MGHCGTLPGEGRTAIEAQARQEAEGKTDPAAPCDRDDNNSRDANRIDSC
jgi:hypothetical protein